MSSQRGNVSRSRQQKHKNTTAYKNNLHNKTQKMMSINKTEHPGICQRCKEIIEWKVKYGKYKPLTVARKCNKCQEKSVKHAYYTICISCGSTDGTCCKCGEKKDIVLQPGLSAAEQAAENSRQEQELHFLTERQRRSFVRLQGKGEIGGEAEGKNVKKDSDCDSCEEDSSEDLDRETLETESSKCYCDGSTEENVNQAELCMKVESDLTLKT